MGATTSAQRRVVLRGKEVVERNGRDALDYGERFSPEGGVLLLC